MNPPVKSQRVRWAIGLIHLYRGLVSPWLSPSCRFLPTCSEYAIEVIDKHGLMHGLWRACGRLLRCHPLHSAGVDLPD